MSEYILAQNGAQNGVTEFLVLRLIGDIYHVIAKSGSADNARQIMEALNYRPEPRLGYADLR